MPAKQADCVCRKVRQAFAETVTDDLRNSLGAEEGEGGDSDEERGGGGGGGG